MRQHFGCRNISGKAAIAERKIECGFTLVEVLIALVVLAIGLLGLAALQNFGLRFNNQSYQRTQATALIYEMIDCMRANPAGVANGNYTLPQTSNPPALTTNCSVSACTNSLDMAIYDQNRWITDITQRAVLAGGSGRIKPLGANLYDITVYWKEQSVNMQQDVTVQLP